MNILLTSAGRRTYLVRYFKEAQKEGALVFASNSGMSPALCEADGHILTPLIYEDGYVDFLIDACRKRDIRMIIPLFDLDVWMLSKNRDRFLSEGILPAVSESSLTAICEDKALMAKELGKLGVRTPGTFLSSEDFLSSGGFEGGKAAYIKPRFGMGSIGLFRAENEEELKALFGLCRRSVERTYLRYEAEEKTGDGETGSVIIQRELKGQEYGLDIINDFKGNHVVTVVRKKLAMRSGETDEALVLTGGEEHRILCELGRRLGEGLSHYGNMDVDVIINEEDGCPYVLDMNARFGGGYPFSHAAGINLPLAYLCWGEGIIPPADCFKVKRSIHGYKDMDIRIYEEI